MSRPPFPLLSQAAKILPVVRRQFAEAAARCTMPVGFSLDMVPILEEELLGYELIPVGVAETCLTLGCKRDGAPVVRKEFLANTPPAPLQLAARDGVMIARSARALPSRSGRRDLQFDDWLSAAKFACAELGTLFVGAPGRPPLLNLRHNASLEQALAAAASRLAEWSPIIHFCGLPNEEQLGYALYGADGGHGELVFRHPDQWMLYWRSAGEAVREVWPVTPEADLTGHERAPREYANVEHIRAHLKLLR
jgi:hypothetical protein